MTELLTDQLTDAEIADFMNRVHVDTGFCGRRLLGYDYDLTIEGERVPGGIRADGPHADICAAMDSPQRNLLILAPRGSYKSTIAQAKIIQTLLAHPTHRVLYGMHTMADASAKVAAIRDILESNALINDERLWGGVKGFPWRRDRFSVRGAESGRQECSLQCFGVDKPATGGHYELIILDDLVTHLNSASPDGIEKVKACFRMVSPLLVNGGKLIIIGTRYHDLDLYGWILKEIRETFHTLVLDAGVELIEEEGGQKRIEGTGRFPHLTRERLELEFKRMGSNVVDWSSQYLNRIVPGNYRSFYRSQFRQVIWDPDSMDVYTGFVLTDTATSLKDEACYSVVAYVMFDEADNAYVADMRVGHFSTNVFVDHFIDVLSKWGSRCYHRGEVWERIALNVTFRSMIDRHPKRGNLRFMPIEVSRHGSDDNSKVRRIRSLEGRFAHGKIHFLNTIPRTFAKVNKVELLWDAEGYVDENGLHQAAGELVDQFISFPRYHWRDIPDALADIDAVVTEGNRLIGHCTPRALTLRRIALNGGPGRNARHKWKAGDEVEMDLRTRKPVKRAPKDGDWADRIARANGL